MKCYRLYTTGTLLPWPNKSRTIPPTPSLQFTLILFPYEPRYIQRVKTVINNNPIEKVSEFKYLGYLISDYKSDLEDKIQTYNKINGVIRRHFGKQMTKETKSRIHNITAKAALKFGNEGWVLKKRD
jgi:hypothetical protein